MTPPTIDIHETFFSLEQGWRKFLRARAQTANSFRINSFAWINPGLLSTVFPITLMTSQLRLMWQSFTPTLHLCFEHQSMP